MQVFYTTPNVWGSFFFKVEIFYLYGDIHIFWYPQLGKIKIASLLKSVLCYRYLLWFCLADACFTKQALLLSSRPANETTGEQKYIEIFMIFFQITVFVAKLMRFSLAMLTLPVLAMVFSDCRQSESEHANEDSVLIEVPIFINRLAFIYSLMDTSIYGSPDLT